MRRLHLLLSKPLAEAPESSPEAASAIITCYQALWHPTLLRDCESLPSIRALDNLPKGDGLVLAVLKSCHDQASDLLRKDLSELNASVVLSDQLTHPHELAQQLSLSSENSGLVEEFFAVGYAYLGLQVLLRNLGQSEKLEGTQFYSEIQQAADLHEKGEIPAAQDALAAALDVLHGVRQSAYPATVHWVDLALMPPKGSQEVIRERLLAKSAWNLLANAAEVQHWPQDLCQAARLQMNEARFEILGGATTSRPLSWLPFESRIWELRHAAEIYQTVLDREVDSFASRTATMYPDLPQILMKFGFRYALHATFDGSKFPVLRGPKLHWTAADGSIVEALARTAIHAGDESTGLSIFKDLAHILDTDRSATIVLTHWVQAPARWYASLLRIQEHVELFGKFETFSDYFLHASLPDGPTRTRVEEYAANATVQVTTVPWVKHFQTRARLDAARSLAGIAQILTGSVQTDGGEIETRFELGAEIAEDLQSMESEILHRISEAVLRGAEFAQGYLVLNPCSFARRIPLEVEGIAEQLHVDKPVRAFEWGPIRSALLVDVPGWGYAWFPRSSQAAAEQPKLEKVANGRKLRNTVFEIEIDRHTGGVRGAWLLRDGYSRLGQQIVHSAGSKMICRSLEITGKGTVFGEITTSGEIRDPAGKRLLAEFRQSVRLWRGKQQATIRIHLEPRNIVPTEVREGYFACRWAWPDEKTTVRPAAGFSMGTHHGAEIEAAEFIEIREAAFTANIVAPGLVRHRRVDYRILDTILTLDHQGGPIDFQFNIALNHPNPWGLLYDCTWPAPVIAVDRGPPAVGPTGWFANLSTENVLASCISPIVGECPGVSLRLFDAAGVGGRAKLRFARKHDAARLVNFKGELLYDLHDEDDAIPVDHSALEMQQVEVYFPSPESRRNV